RHQQIGQDDVVAIAVEQRERLGAAARPVRHVAGGPDEGPPNVADDGVVVHQEDLRVLSAARHTPETVRSRCHQPETSTSSFYNCVFGPSTRCLRTALLRITPAVSWSVLPMVNL